MGYVERGLPAAMPSLYESAAAKTALKFVSVCVTTHLVFFLLWRGLEGNSAAQLFVFDEERLVENLSAAIFLGGGFYAARLWWTDTGSAPLDRLALAGIGVLGAIGFLDEISFGERILHYEVYEIMGIRVDGMHDLVEVVNTVRREWFGPIGFFEKVFLAALASSFFIGALVLWLVAISGRRTPRCLQLPALALACAFLFEFGLSSVVDIRVFSFDGDQAMEEVGEMNMAILLAGLARIVSQRLVDHRRRSHRPIHPG
ncbi:hypothetical protein [Aquibium microcysteis]|uniref:hypothetical protein n=1 Tax=Aquibium microcysteis TaxID=675281 RepID=UPI00165CF8AC|nr:hypothetical protein [Aquibium microcysteis]